MKNTLKLLRQINSRSLPVFIRFPITPRPRIPLSDNKPPVCCLPLHLRMVLWHCAICDLRLILCRRTARLNWFVIHMYWYILDGLSRRDLRIYKLMSNIILSRKLRIPQLRWIRGRYLVTLLTNLTRVYLRILTLYRIIRFCRLNLLLFPCAGNDWTFYCLMTQLVTNLTLNLVKYRIF